MGSYHINTAGADTWTVPAGVFSIDAACVGNGGDGEAAVADTAGGEGGGGGAFASTTAIAVTPGESVHFFVSTRGSIDKTWISIDAGATHVVEADYGENAVTGTPGVGGLATNSIGDVTRNGGSGEYGFTGSGNVGGGGAGGAAGDAVAGNDGAPGGSGAGGNGGAGVTQFGVAAQGEGGDGGFASSPGTVGSDDGGGGGGGGGHATTPGNGGLARNGAIFLSWLDPDPPEASAGSWWLLLEAG